MEVIIKKSALILTFILTVLILCYFVYKKETLTCDFSENICSLNKTNLYNVSDIKILAAPDKIEDVTVKLPQVKLQRKLASKTSYEVYFVLKDKSVRVFNAAYFHKKEAEQAAEKIKKALESGKNFSIDAI